MFYQLILQIVFLFHLFFGTSSDDSRYEIDPIHSRIGFSVRHLMINKVKGHFTDFSGSITYNEDDITKSSVHIVIIASSITTGDDKRDGHLRSRDFFFVEKYPEITFNSKRIEVVDDAHVAVGDLTIRGIAKEIRLPFEITGVVENWGKKLMGIESKLKIKRKDYGVSWSNTMDNGGLIVGNNVTIEINLEAATEITE